MTNATRSRAPEVLEQYLRDISRYPLLTPEEERRLARTQRAGDTRAGEQLVRANLRFVVKLANEYRRYGLHPCDVIQEGNIGLMLAVRRFDPDRGVRLVTYATWWIRSQIHAYIARSWSVVKLGTTLAERTVFFQTALGGDRLDPSAADADRTSARLAAKLGVTARAIGDIRHRVRARDLSLEAPVAADSGVTWGDLLHAPLDDDAALGDAFLRDQVADALGRLDQRERYLVEARVLRDDPLTLKQVGEELGFSRERARQIEARAHGKLRQHLTAATPELATRDSRRGAARASSPPRAPATP
jgi:RNA polymerase sigma-32 factor